jgi:hypothetical protein
MIKSWLILWLVLTVYLARSSQVSPVSAYPAHPAHPCPHPHSQPGWRKTTASSTRTWHGILAPEPFINLAPRADSLFALLAYHHTATLPSISTLSSRRLLRDIFPTFGERECVCVRDRIERLSLVRCLGKAFVHSCESTDRLA